MAEQLISLYKKIAIAYVRTSGNVNPKTSIPNQINDIKKYCEENHIFLKYILVDEAETGRYTDNRDQYKRIKSIVKSEHIDMVIVSFADRFARDSFEYILSIRELVKDGRQFIALYEGVVEECTSALELSMTAIKVELENEQRTKRLMDGRKTSIEAGKFQTTPPYGYKKDKELKLFVIEQEARVIRKLFEMYNNGYKMTHIVNELNRNLLYEGQPKMSPARMRSYIKNKLYTGYIYSKQQIYHEDGSFHIEYIQESKVPHEQIISEDVFNKARSRWDKNHKRIRTYFYLCSGLLKCPCGNNTTAAIDKNEYFPYEPKGRKKTCCRFAIEEVDRKLLSFLTELNQLPSEDSDGNLKDPQYEIDQLLKESEQKFALGKISKKTFLKNIGIAQMILAELEIEQNQMINGYAYESYANVIQEKDYKRLKKRLKKEKFTFTLDGAGQIKILTWEVPI